MQWICSLLSVALIAARGSRMVVVSPLVSIGLFVVKSTVLMVVPTRPRPTSFFPFPYGVGACVVRLVSFRG